MSKIKQSEKFIELRAEGLSYSDIAKNLGVSKQTICAWSKKFRLEVENAKTINFDVLYRKYAIAKEKRIEAFGERLEKVLAELDKRDLSKVPTEKLFKIAFDLSDRLKAEAEPLRIGERVEGLNFDIENVERWEI